MLQKDAFNTSWVGSEPINWFNFTTVSCRIYYMFSTVVSSIDADPEVWIRLVTSRNSGIQVMLYQEDDLDLDDDWLTADEQLTSFSKAIWNIVERIKV